MSCLGNVIIFFQFKFLYTFRSKVHIFFFKEIKDLRICNLKFQSGFVENLQISDFTSTENINHGNGGNKGYQ